MQDMQETQVRPLGQEDPLEEGSATHSSILAWRIPWTEEPWVCWAAAGTGLGAHSLLGDGVIHRKPGGLRSIGFHRLRHN